MGLFKEFKEFVGKGNVIDLAVGLVVGAAFGKIVTSLVSDIIMPPIGFLTNGINFTDIKIVIKKAVIENGHVTSPDITINIGNFIQTVFEFLIIAFSIFIVVKYVNKLRDTEEDKKEPKKEEVLLKEIRDILKNK